MEIRGCGKNMMSSNDPRHIIKMFNNIAGKYYLADHDKKIIKHGYFLNCIELNGDGKIIKYNTDNLLFIVVPPLLF